jgi:hypothetical protein
VLFVGFVFSFFAPVAGSSSNLKRKADEVTTKGAKGKGGPDAKKQNAAGKGGLRKK